LAKPEIESLVFRHYDLQEMAYLGDLEFAEKCGRCLSQEKMD
jgi:hypothetical protein